MTELKSYAAWDAVTRWFHWINVLCVFALAAVGVVILKDSALGLTSDGKVLVKITHSLIGYVFVLNLLWRFIWAFVGNPYARWKSIIPGGKGFIQSLRNYVFAFMSGKPEHYLGHNPLGRIAVFVLFVLLAIQAITGLVLAGTDIFYPPFGHWIAQWVAANGVPPESLLPYSPDMYDAMAYKSMRDFRSPYIAIHEFNFFVLCFIVLLHIAAVIITEVKEQGAIISAMFTGRKIFSKDPVDVDKNGSEFPS